MSRGFEGVFEESNGANGDVAGQSAAKLFVPGELSGVTHRRRRRESSC